MPSNLRVISTWVAFLTIAPSASCLSADPTTAPAPPGYVEIRDTDTQSILDVMLPPIKFDAVGLGAVIDSLRNIHGPNSVKFSVDWKTLEAAGVTKTTPVTVSLHNVKLSKSLRIIFDACGGENKIRYEMVDGVILITTAPGLLHSRTYDIRYVFERLDAAERDKLSPQVLQLIKDTVDSDGWRVDGKSCEIDVKKGELIVAQTTENLKSIENLLRELRQSRPAPSAWKVNAQPTTAPGDRELMDTLELMLPPIKFDAVGLGDVIDYLRYVNGPKSLEFSVDWKALKTIGVTPTTPVTVNLRNIKFSKALRIILDNCGGKDKIRFETDDGVTIITTAAGLIHSRTYDIRYIFEYHKDVAPDKLVPQVIHLVKDTIDTDQWGVDGKSCEIDAKKRQLIVAQTTENLNGIVKLLTHLREVTIAAATQPTTNPFP